MLQESDTSTSEPQLVPDPVCTLANKIAELESEVLRLRGTILQMQRQQIELDASGHYPFAVFQYNVSLIRGGSLYGACVDYAAASNTPGCRQVTIEQVVAWKRHGVPRWAIEQLPQMVFAPRIPPPRHDWNAQEQAFLLELCQVKRSVAELAALCAQRFDRVVTTGAIKGQLHRLHIFIRQTGNKSERGAK